MKMLQVSKCLIGLAVMVLQSCDVAENRRDLLCGNWESVEGKPDVLIYKEGEAYKVTVFKRSGIRRRLKPETYLLQEENGNLFMNTGFRIDVAYNEATDVLTFSPNGDYVRVKPQPETPAARHYFIDSYYGCSMTYASALDFNAPSLSSAAEGYFVVDVCFEYVGHCTVGDD